MAENEACCTCASLLNPSATSTLAPSYEISLETEKPVSSSAPRSPPRRLPCCSRSICGSCLSSNPRFQTYCPFCQVSTEPSPLPQGLRDPPAYSEPGEGRAKTSDEKNGYMTETEQEQPPPYTTAPVNGTNGTDTNGHGEDVIHHLHADDTIPGLALAYHVPALVLRTHNNLYSESLLYARKTLLIPRSHYSGPSLAPKPVESEEETERKSAIRRFMVGAKCHEYEMAELYLKQAAGDVEMALMIYGDDERWERENPMKSKEAKGKGRRGARNSIGGTLMSQLR